MFKIVKQTEGLKTECLKSLIYGEPGIGKTSLAFTSEKPLLLDFDKGMQRACYRLDGVIIEKWEDVIEFQKSNDLKEFAPKTIICDTVGTMLDNYIASYVKRVDPKNSRRGGELSLQGYGSMKNIFQQFLDWSISNNINLIFIAHLTEEREGDNVKYIPKVTGGSYDILRQTMDLIGYCESNMNKRVIDFMPKDRHIGKDCAEIGTLEIPDYRSSEYKIFFSDIINKTLGRMNDLSENQVQLLEQINLFEEMIKSSDLNSEYCNHVIEELKKETNKSVQLQKFNILKSLAGQNGVKYNSETKKFQ